jgi:hypothetical protein
MHPPPLMSMFLRHEDWSNGLSIATFVKSFLSRTQGGAGPCSTAPDRRECRQSRRRDPCPDFIGMHAIRQKPMSRNRLVHAQTIAFYGSGSGLSLSCGAPHGARCVPCAVPNAARGDLSAAPHAVPCHGSGPQHVTPSASQRALRGRGQPPNPRVKEHLSGS